MKALLALWFASLTAVGLCGCANAPPAPPPAVPTALFRDALFKPASAPADASRVFSVSPAMQDYLDHQIAQQVRKIGARQGLLDALYTRGQLKLEYDAEVTRNASEAFDARRGNCLSLVLMTAAFAKAMHLPVHFQSVYVDEVWSRSNDLVVLSGHVNLTLGRLLGEQSVRGIEAEAMTVDFLPSADLRRQRVRVIAEETVLAMYMNNRAAELLQQGQVDEAYWWARGAVVYDPHFTAGLNTLGVVYRRAGWPSLAEQTFREVLAQEPANAQTLGNLILVLRGQGRDAELQVLEARLHEVQPIAPFKFFDDGVAAMRAGDYRSARALFERELQRTAYFHEIHFWMALANYALGDLAAARKYLLLARDNSTTLKDQQMYAAKLQSLRGAVRVQ